MIARLVSEAVSFNRGTDPKDAMGIGDSKARFINKLDLIAKKMGFEQELLEPEEIGNFLYNYNSQPVYKWVRRKGEKYDLNTNDYQGMSKRAYNPVKFLFSGKFPQELVLIRDEDDEEPLGVYWKAGKYEGHTGTFTFEKIKGWERLFGPATPLQESVEFTRGDDPYSKLRIGKHRFGLKPYPQMTVEEFDDWYSEHIDTWYYSDLGTDMVMDLLISEEEMSDEELEEYISKDNEVPKDIIEKLIAARQYFWDFEYTKNLT